MAHFAFDALPLQPYVRSAHPASASLPTNTNAPIQSMSIEIHRKFLLGRLVLSCYVSFSYGYIVLHIVLQSTQVKQSAVNFYSGYKDTQRESRNNFDFHCQLMNPTFQYDHRLQFSIRYCTHFKLIKFAVRLIIHILKMQVLLPMRSKLVKQIL